MSEKFKDRKEQRKVTKTMNALLLPLLPHLTSEEKYAEPQENETEIWARNKEKEKEEFVGKEKNMDNELSAYQHYLIVFGYLAQNNLNWNIYVRESLESLLRLAQRGEKSFRDKYYNKNRLNGQKEE